MTMPKNLQLPWLCGQNIPLISILWLVKKKHQTNWAGVGSPPLLNIIFFFAMDAFHQLSFVLQFYVLLCRDPHRGMKRREECEICGEIVWISFNQFQSVWISSNWSDSRDLHVKAHASSINKIKLIFFETFDDISCKKDSDPYCLRHNMWVTQCVS